MDAHPIETSVLENGSVRPDPYPRSCSQSSRSAFQGTERTTASEALCPGESLLPDFHLELFAQRIDRREPEAEVKRRHMHVRQVTVACRSGVKGAQDPLERRHVPAMNPPLGKDIDGDAATVVLDLRQVAFDGDADLRGVPREVFVE